MVILNTSHSQMSHLPVTGLEARELIHDMMVTERSLGAAFRDIVSLRNDMEL